MRLHDRVDHEASVSHYQSGIRETILTTDALKREALSVVKHHDGKAARKARRIEWQVRIVQYQADHSEATYLDVRWLIDGKLHAASERL